MAPSQLRYTFPRSPSPSALHAFLDKLPYCSQDIVSFRADPGGGHIDLAVRAGADHQHLMGKVDGFFKKVARGFFTMSTEVVVDRRDAAVEAHAGVEAGMRERRWILPYAPGCVGLQGPALALYDYFDARFVAIARSFGAARMSFPTLIAVDTLNRCDYLSSFPHHVTLAPPITGDVDAIDDFKRNVIEGGPVLASAESPDHVLSPTVCIHCYQALAGRRLAAGELLRATAIGNCFRHERGRLDHGTRLWDFNMREIIFIGGNAEVVAARAQSIERVVAWLDELGMRYWIETATDPFFVDNYSAQSFFQLANKTKYELLVELPGVERPLAVGSFNVHHDFFGRSFDITLAGGEAADTGCTAFGVERFVYGFVSQFGYDVASWPAPVRAAVEGGVLACL